MKRKLFRALLIILILAELWLLTGFLPQPWQEKMYTQLHKVWPAQPYIAHPDMEHELQAFRPLGLALLTVLVVINGGVIVVLWTRRNT